MDSQIAVSTWNFGTLKCGTSVTACKLRAGDFSMTVLDWGGVVQELTVPDAQGNPVDVVMGFDALQDYAENAYVGAIIGRYANRIANAEFLLDGVRYPITVDGKPGHAACALHGGDAGYDRRMWTMKPFEHKDAAGVVLELVSPDGESGFPGTLHLTTTYTLSVKGIWTIEYAAVTDKATPVNLTQHSYFNLGGHGNGTVLDDSLRVCASRYTTSTPALIPIGIASVEGTPYDLRVARRIGDYPPGYDTNFVPDRNDAGSVLAAELSSAKTGIVMQVWTTEPGVQIYTGGHFPKGLRGKKGAEYGPHCGVALETQHFPDSPNRPDFPDTVLHPGQKFYSKTEYRFSTK